MLHIWRSYRKHPVVDLAVTLVTAVVIAYIVQLWVVKPYRVPTASMEQTVLISDRIIAARFYYHLRDPERRDIIVFHPNGIGNQHLNVDSASDETFVKRLIGLPGEWIGATGGKVYVCQGTAPRAAVPIAETEGCNFLDEPYLGSPQEAFGPEKVPEGRYFMMGDNRSNSDDSRVWGAIPRRQIIGRAFMTYWPLTRISFY